MRLSCSCGVFIGFVLAMLVSGAAYYYFHLRRDPDASARGMQQLEERWERTKESGDRVLDTIRPYAVPSPPKAVEVEKTELK